MRPLALLILALGGCNNLPTAVPRLPAVRIIVTRPCRTVAVGRECETEAMALDANGDEVVSAFAWTTGDPSIATVSPKPGFDTTIGEVRGVAVGNTTLEVHVGGQPDLSVVSELSVIPSNNPGL